MFLTCMSAGSIVLGSTYNFGGCCEQEGIGGVAVPYPYRLSLEHFS